MLDSFWCVVLPAVAVGAVFSLFLERLLQPSPKPFWRRPAAALAIHVGLWLYFSTGLLLVVQRPFFAVGALLAGFLFIVLVSNAKADSLHEPFIFQDFEYFRDALRHPRLYLPFLGAGRAVLAVLALAAAIVAGLSMEESLLDGLSNEHFLAGSGVLALTGLLLIGFGTWRRIPVCFDAASDLRNLGLLPALWRYGEEEHRPCRPPMPFAAAVSPALEVPARPTLVVVQSESFFDPRRLFSGIRDDLLSEYDALRARAICHGPLAVAAWGANTVRTEFAFLSGLSADSLGVHRFNPYRRLGRQGVATLASFLKQLGYRTICVHPYVASFYSRHRVLPRLGFDEFIDLRAFAGAARSGPYVSDLAVADRVCSLLQEAGGQPLFVFVITMENHGPLHLESVAPGDEDRFYSVAPPAGCDELTIYLRHLANADRMLGRLRVAIEALPDPACLCWFGDHVPIMPAVYRTLARPDGQTDYLLWRTGGEPGAGERREVSIERLAGLLLREMGFREPTG
ncbi:LTA synthase family protein [Accumulibacter sp.]|uniref:LTA synthase family protein n=1 Tax=Accumulibacter sp. TaxID=2053492 RepID=UPI001AD25A6B|nr:LTA synthase family protein [Accumulibacter sp.]MBN8455422.1 LTA synthase family protein [Accumulibacter sp.]